VAAGGSSLLSDKNSANSRSALFSQVLLCFKRQKLFSVMLVCDVLPLLLLLLLLLAVPPTLRRLSCRL
jgi:hypothetical protein